MTPVELLLAILGSSCGAAAVAGIFGVIQWGLNRKATKEDKAADRSVASCKARGEEIQRVEKRVDSLYVANRIQLYDRIKHLGKAYIRQGEISPEDLKDLIDMHRCYHDDLGGNGFLDEVMEQVRHLPIKI